MLNLRVIVLLIGFSILSIPAYSQKTEKAFGECTMKIENSMSNNEAIQKAIQLAQNNAIENAFGKVITQNNTSYIENVKNGEKIQTNSTFNFLSNSIVKGEWVEDIDKPEIKYDNNGNDRFIIVKVRGRVRELKEEPLSFECYTLSGTEKKYKTDKFNEGQNIFMYFKAAKNGYAAIYTSDPDLRQTFLLLPYKKSNLKTCIPIEADKEYYFFSKKFDYFNDKQNCIDEQEMSVFEGKQQSQQQIFVLFSADELSKPALSDKTKELLDAKALKDGITLPKCIDDEGYQKWIQDYRVRNKKVQYSSFFIQVSKI